MILILNTHRSIQFLCVCVRVVGEFVCVSSAVRNMYTMLISAQLCLYKATTFSHRSALLSAGQANSDSPSLSLLLPRRPWGCSHSLGQLQHRGEFRWGHLPSDLLLCLSGLQRGGCMHTHSHSILMHLYNMMVVGKIFKCTECCRSDVSMNIAYTDNCIKQYLVIVVYTRQHEIQHLNTVMSIHSSKSIFSSLS